jgi:hypothetical protein
MRQYVEPVEVRQGRVSGIEGPAQFLWRHRLYLVRDVLGFWVESSSWWRTGGTGFPERKVWRVEAGRGRESSRVIVDLALNPVDDQWLLLRTYD